MQLYSTVGPARNQTCVSMIPVQRPNQLSYRGCPGVKLDGVLGGGGCDTPQNTNHLDWQGESSGLAGQSKILNDRM